MAVSTALPAAEIRDAVPNDVYMVVHGRHNPEREDQRKYYEEAWNTVRETRIVERLIEIVEKRMPQGDLDTAQGVLTEIQEAAAPIDWEACAGAQEFIYAQSMAFPSAQHLGLARLTPQAAASLYDGIVNLMKLAEKYSDGDIPVSSSENGDVRTSRLVLPSDFPFQPTVAVVGDVLLVSTDHRMARTSISMLEGSTGQSKLDDPRIVNALKDLPEPEDSLIFYDGKQQLEQLRSVGQFIRNQGFGNPDADRFAGLLDTVLAELLIVDHEVTVEYPDGNTIRTASHGEFLPDFEKRVLGRMFGSGKPFQQWHQWVPENATAYSLTTGLSLHPLHEYAITLLRDNVPESQAALDAYAAFQQQIDLNLDEDLLQAFSGECISISLAAESGTRAAQPQFALLLRCTKSERIDELIGRLFEFVGGIPQLQAQQFGLIESTELEGFHEISAGILMMFGARPVIGFHEDWLVVASSAGAVDAVREAVNSETSITETEAYRRFGLEISGPVQSISYTNRGDQIREMAAAVTQLGTMMPMLMGMAGTQADPEVVGTLQEVFALLPDVGRIIARFDFLDASLSVTQAGDQPGTWTTRAATLVRPRYDQ